LTVRPEDAECSDEYHPVPEEHVDGLVVEIDRQYTLDSVWVNVDHVLTSDLEVAQSHAWKRHITLLRPVLVLDETADHVVAECVVLGCEHNVEEEQLTDHVDDVEHLRDDEQRSQIAAPPATRRLHCSYFANGYF